MSIKTRKQKQAKKNDIEKVEKEPPTKFEKIAGRVIVIAGALAIIAIILFAIPWKGEKQTIANKYPSLTEDNCFELINYKELIEKINNGEEFDLVLVNTKEEDVNYFVFCIDDIVRDYKKENLNVCEKVYMFNTSKINEEETNFFKEIEGTKKPIQQPTLMHFVDSNNNGVSTNEDSTCRDKLVDFNNNYYNIILNYFRENYKEEK